jgi:hypothetical protein
MTLPAIYKCSIYYPKKMSNLMNGVKNKNWWLEVSCNWSYKKTEKILIVILLLVTLFKGQIEDSFQEKLLYISRYVTGRFSNLKNMSRIRKKTFYLQFCMVLLKVWLVLQNWKEGKNSYGGYPTEFAGLTQNPKKIYQNIKSTDQDEHFSKKIMLSTLKKKRSQKLVWELPDGICRLNAKS